MVPALMLISYTVEEEALSHHEAKSPLVQPIPPTQAAPRFSLPRRLNHKLTSFLAFANPHGDPRDPPTARGKSNKLASSLSSSSTDRQADYQ